jgi:hypothetical protein
MKREPLRSEFVLCVENEGADDLELRKVYEVLPDSVAARQGYARVVDESGEDYLYPQEYFVPVKLPHAASRAFKVQQPEHLRSTASVGRKRAARSVRI